MVSRSYMSLDAQPTSPAKRAFDQTVVPALIDAAGRLEEALENLAVRTRQSPALSLAAAFAVGTLASLVLFRRR